MTTVPNFQASMLMLRKLELLRADFATQIYLFLAMTSSSSSFPMICSH